MPIVITYRDSDITQNVTQAAKEAGLWNQRRSKEDDKIKDRKGYFKASFPRRDTKTKTIKETTHRIVRWGSTKEKDNSKAESKQRQKVA